jgi:hypothetical protein
LCTYSAPELRLQPLAQPRAGAVRPLERRLVLEHVEHRHPGGDRDRVLGEGAGLEDLARSGVLAQRRLHQVGAAAERTERHPAADRLADGGEIGRDAEVAGRAGEPHPVRAQNLVEDQHDAVRGRGVADGARELPGRRDAAAARERHRLHDHGRQLVRLLAEDGKRGLGLVVGEEHDVVGHVGRHARVVDDWERAVVRAFERARVRRDHERVVGPVEVPLALGDLAPAGDRARDADRGARGLGAGVDEPQALQVGHMPPDPLGELDRTLHRHHRVGHLRHLLPNGSYHRRVAVAEQYGAGAHQQVDVLVPVHVRDPRSAGRAQEHGIGSEPLRRAADALREDFARADPKRVRPGRATGVACGDPLSGCNCHIGIRYSVSPRYTAVMPRSQPPRRDGSA